MNITNYFKISQEEFDQLKTTEYVQLKCSICLNTYSRIKKKILYNYNNFNKLPIYCSNKCQFAEISLNARSLVHCENCGLAFSKIKSHMQRSINHFCSQSCAASFNNKNKTHGTRRSKLEVWLELKLKELYPNFEILFNSKEIINSELDIYIPSLKLAFELNGIFHYEPIYGKDKLNQIQNNDSNKFQKCQEKEISLCIIDTSSQKRFTEQSSKKFLDIITNIINDLKNTDI